MEWKTWKSIIDICYTNAHYSPCVAIEFLKDLNQKFLDFGIIDLYVFYQAKEYIINSYHKTSCPGKMGCQIIEEHKYFKER